MANPSIVQDPLKINLCRQRDRLATRLPSDSPFIPVLANLTTNEDFLNTISHLLLEPSLTEELAHLFRPILFDLCARWLDSADVTKEQFVAICLLLEVQEELYPILFRLLRKPSIKSGPLLVFSGHDVFLAYFRVLRANQELPSQLEWPLTPLVDAMWTQDLDNGTRYLAVQCYALQTGMAEQEREKIEREIFGEICIVDCPVAYGTQLDGLSLTMDGWIIPFTEMKRVQNARNRILNEPEEYFLGVNIIPITENQLSPLVANLHGIFMLRSQKLPENTIPSPVVITSTTADVLRNMALRLSLRLPILLTGPPSSGKSFLLSHLATVLLPGTNQIINIHLADTSLDPRSLLGSYVSSQKHPGIFEWKEGVLIRAMREGKWVVFKDIDRGSSEVLGVIKPLIESLSIDKWIGGRAYIDIPGRNRVVAAQDFAVFATRSIQPSRIGTFPTPTFFGAHKLSEIIVPSPTSGELHQIIDCRFPRLSGITARVIIRLWEAVCVLGSSSSTRDIGTRELEKFCTRISNMLSPSFAPMDIENPSFLSLFPTISIREEIYLDARDVFFGAGTLTATARSHVDAISHTIAEHLALDPDRRDWLLHRFAPNFDLEKDANGVVRAIRVGRVRLESRPANVGLKQPVARPFAMHRPAVSLLSRIATSVSLSEPVLLTGETGTGKTSVITHLASLLRRPLVSINLSHQTESADLLGGFKPVDGRIPATVLQDIFTDLFGATFSRRKNEKFENEVRKAVTEGKWKRAVGLWKESIKLATQRLQAKQKLEVELDDNQTSRKRRKVDSSQSAWDSFAERVTEFEVQHVHGKSKFAFDFVEGPLVKALRRGDWVLLDEVNLASSETLECISGLLHSPTASITLTEQGALEPVPRHPDFRLFSCMNPATDVGKKDLPPNIRCRFTEIDVPPPDADKETLIHIVTQYIGPSAVGDKAAIMNVAEFYAAVKALAESRQIADGSNHRPHYSMRTLTRALTFASDIVGTFGLRRALWEGCLMAFTMVLNSAGAETVAELAQKYILAGVRNPRSILSKEPSSPSDSDNYVKFGPFYLEKGPLPVDPMDTYIMTPSVQNKLIDLGRIIVTRRFPVLIEGPTSSGKTSSIEYLAKRTGHRFIRINNHEHTDIQEYLGSYVPDPNTGKLVFKDGLLVQALRNGDWIVLDELNLAPTDVLEALNRLLDDNRELLIPETHEVVKPHPHFMLFATQNPPGLYAGRKVLSRAFRNRFLEVHFEDVPQPELESILCQRCLIAPSYGKKIVAVFCELQKRRQTGRVFESKHGFATLRDLFRWAGRDAVSYQELAENGYMLLAERARRDDDKAAVKEVIERIMGVHIDQNTLYNPHHLGADFQTYLGCPIPSSTIVWTKAMQRLFVLLSRALRFNEPVLLVGETGSGKTSVCQIYAEAQVKELYGLNCHQNTETADIIGGLRPVRGRSSLEAQLKQDLVTILRSHEVLVSDTESLDRLFSMVESLNDLDIKLLSDLRLKLGHSKSIFEWHDGPLISAMRAGDVFLLDEISLADDSILERLNSVLESSRTIVLAEKGGDTSDDPVVIADESFKLVATMNPGGDYGKKELSPALRNRFTEIWVPAVSDRGDLEMIVSQMWEHEVLRPYTPILLDFIEWLCLRVQDTSLLNLRDILAWVQFSNAAVASDGDCMPSSEIFHHAAHMTYLDGLGSLPQLSSLSSDALFVIKQDAKLKLQSSAPISELTFVPLHDPAKFVQLGSFSIPKGPKDVSMSTFNLQVPTTQENAMRVVRASQVTKPILLEGSPGVGKTSLIMALAEITGHELHRINLSDQTDLMDLFGSDLPVEGGNPGEFAWKDAEFLTALQEGHWVLLDEMNLAPQTVLEGLNAILDHRGTVFIPELGRTFTRHPKFRIFAAQNPLSQGGGRKGLPKSFVNRFTKVYIQPLQSSDIFLVCRHVFPTLDADILHAMIAYNGAMSDTVVTKGLFGRQGAPWEFNLRDVIRWGTLMRDNPLYEAPVDFLRTIYLQRFRDIRDRDNARQLYEDIFRLSAHQASVNPPVSITSSYMQVGAFFSSRKPTPSLNRDHRIIHASTCALESLGHCVNESWLSIVVGPHDVGKTAVIRTLADLTRNYLHVFHVNSSTDTMDILGGFEQADSKSRIYSAIDALLSLVRQYVASASGSRESCDEAVSTLQQTAANQPLNVENVLKASFALSRWLRVRTEQFSDTLDSIDAALTQCKQAGSDGGRFEWADGPLVSAMKQGHWLLLDGANLCTPSVLDRLNSLCEPNGVLILSERGYINGKIPIVTPHPNFRLFMTVDPKFGELSRAMRNRGVEIALPHLYGSDDRQAFLDYRRLPLMMDIDEQSYYSYENSRRGIVTSSVTSLSVGTAIGRPLAQYSNLSNLVDGMLALILSSSEISSDGAFWRFFSRVYVPDSEFWLRRCLKLVDTQAFHRFEKFAQHFPEVVTKKISAVKAMSAISREVVSTFSSDQPFDFYLHIPFTPESDLKNIKISPHLLLLELLNVGVSIAHDENSFPDNILPIIKSRVNTQEHHKRATESLNFVLKLTRSFILDNLEGNITVQLIQIIREVADHVGYLRKAANDQFFDYSLVQAVSGLIRELLENGPPEVSSLVQPVRDLQAIVSPTTGLGLTDIWMNLLPVTMGQQFEALRELENLCRSVADLEVSDDLHKKIFDVMALSCLHTDKSPDTSLMVLQEDLKQRLLKEIRSETPASMIGDARLMLLVELGVLARSRQAYDPKKSKEFIISATETILLSRQKADASFLRVIPLQHFLWRLDIEDRVKSLSIPLVEYQLHWLDSFLEAQATSVEQLLFEPLQVKAVLAACLWDRSPLVSMSEQHQNIPYLGSIITLQASNDLSRPYQFEAVFVSSVMMLSACFDESLPSTASSIKDVLFWLESQIHSPIMSSHLHRLLLATQNFCETNTDVSKIARLGECFNAFCLTLFELCLPDTPIDPAAIRNSTYALLRDKSASLTLQIKLHCKMENAITGNDTNEVATYLHTQNEIVSGALQNAPPLPARNDVSKLHMFWSELRQFHAQVIASSSISSLMELLLRDDAAGSAREEMVQQSITGFLHRMNSVYADYQDVMLPFHLAARHLQMGLHLTRNSRRFMRAAELNQLAKSLVISPTVYSSALLQQFSAVHSQSLSPFKHILIKTASLAFDSSNGSDLNVESLATISEQALRLWLMDRAADTDRDENAATLYKRKITDHDMISDAEREEIEFLELFPSFEDSFGSEKVPTADLSDEIAQISEADMYSFFGSYQAIFMSNSDAALSRFHDIRLQCTSVIIQTEFTSLRDSLSIDSIHFQLRLLQSRAQKFESPLRATDKNYNFYRDMNVMEAKKATHIIKSLCDRLGCLIQEWPEQIVLQDLRGRCEQALTLDSRSPIASLLVTLEQILTHTGDWEMYANRDNTLKVHREAIISQIVEWRRLELACWHGLLEAEAIKFEGSVSSWWFRLYEAAIRGPLHLPSEGNSVTEYLNTLVPLLDDFLRTSPLGQFRPRLDLLRYISTQCLLQSRTQTGHVQEALSRVRQVIESTIEYYSLFTLNLSVYLADQRNILEKEIREFIKLASWKDINIHALKQSAQRTHHQLYKTIRKFRDLLRQPIEGRLALETAGALEQAQSTVEYLPLSPLNPFDLENIDIENNESASHLRNISTTLRKYEDILRSHIMPYIEARPVWTVDAFAVEVINSARGLASFTIPASLPREKRAKQAKALLVRKRKAWSDLLKELKRVGFAANVKSDVLARQQNHCWIRDQPVLLSDSESMPIAKKEEIYFHRVSGLLGDLRSIVPTHHSDVTTREIQRGIIFLESGFSLSLDCRSRLSLSFRTFEKIKSVYRRLQAVVLSPGTCNGGEQVLAHVIQVKDILCRLSSALDESVESIGLFNQFGSEPSSIPSSVIITTRSFLDETIRLRDLLIGLVNDVKLSEYPVLLESENSLLKNSREHIDSVSNFLISVSNERPQLHTLLMSTLEWLSTQEIHPLTSYTPSTKFSVDPVIDTLLISAQNIVAQCSETEEDRDKYIRQETDSIGHITDLLSMPKVSEKLESIIAGLHGDNTSQLRRLMPFVGQYVQLVQHQLKMYTYWTKTMFKLLLVLCSVMTSIAKEGFCKPPDDAEAEEGDKGELSEGTGLGEGTGAQNVSKEIEDESQVEGLQGDDGEQKDNEHEQGGKDDTIEMSEDFGGELEDVPDEGDEDADDEEGSEADPEERMGDLDASDPDVVDEKMWGDEQGDDPGKTDEKTGEERSQEKTGESDVVAKEDQQEQKSKNKDDTQPEQSKEQPAEEPSQEDALDDSQANDEFPDTNGAPMDQHVPDADTLDLPDDLDMGELDKKDEDTPADGEDDLDTKDDAMDDVEETSLEQFPDDGTTDHPDDSANPQPPDDTNNMNNEEIDSQPIQTEDTREEDTEMQDESEDHAIAKPDLTSGENTMDSTENQEGEQGDQGQIGKAGDLSGVGQNAPEDLEQAPSQDRSDAENQAMPDANESQAAGLAPSGSKEGQQTSPTDHPLSVNPLRSLGDAIREVQQRFDQILEREEGSTAREKPGGEADASQVEYLQPDDADYDMQALGPSGDDQVAKLDQLHIVDEEGAGEDTAMDVDEPPSDNAQQPSSLEKNQYHTEPSATDHTPDAEGAVLKHASSLSESINDVDSDMLKAEEDRETSDSELVEIELRNWQMSGHSSEGAEYMWKKYESLTHDLAYSLCEQLRLILEPTQATRLKGDYRTGKRLNMKKVISYIASDYTKDKIWLRRTKPSQREYQVLIALDDSRSMSESHSVHLAYQTLALVSKALSRLEAGDIGIARFGQTVDILHGFEGAPFSDQAGMQVMQAFKFDQKATDVLSLLSSSLEVLERAREKRSIGSSTAADLWQLEIIISDGMCQDHEKLRSLLRKAEEQRVMIVFIIVDSLRSHDGAAQNGEGSILTMERAEFKNVGGKMELQLQRYLDSFPFEYYVVLRNVEALPDVLSGTLKQFFERISDE